MWSFLAQMPQLFVATRGRDLGTTLGLATGAPFAAGAGQHEGYCPGMQSS